MASKVICVMGTRPEVIKMAPVVRGLERAGIEAPVLATAQHRELLDQMSRTFGLVPHWDLNVMKPSQTLASVTGEMVSALERIFRESGADAVVAQGDTSTVFCAALSAYFAGVPFGHVEAGLRSGDLQAPFPEEGMRRLASVVTKWHFAPTEMARQALLREGYPDSAIHVTGNTVIDSLLMTASQEALPWPAVPQPGPRQRLILVTVHRRENFGEPICRILQGIRAFAAAHPDALLVYPVHPNPNVFGPAHEILGDVPNVHLTRPLDYPELVHVMKKSFLVLTDSGGIQEEAPALGIPVLVFREVTERPEAVASGGVVLVGCDMERFKDLIGRIWDSVEFHSSLAVPRFPYGRGDSGLRISKVLSRALTGNRA